MKFPTLILFGLALGASCHAQQSAQVLADVLEQKGVIAPDERVRIRAAGSEDAVQMIAAILQKKGLLSDVEAARLLPASATPAATVEQKASIGFPASTTPAAPVTAATRLPVFIYGTALLNSFYNTSLNNNQDVPLFAGKQGTDATGGDKNYGMTVRQSRLGLRYSGPRVGEAQLSGTVEFDMFSGNATLPNSVGFDVPRLRLAYGRLDWRNMSVLAGQDWSIFAPLNPTSLSGYAIPDLAASGNLWIRTPQIRAEFRDALSDTKKLNFQIAATDPNVGDYTSTFSTARVAGVGERGRLPGADSRLSYSDGGLAVGLSGHYSRGKNAGAIGAATVQTAVDSWGVAGDYVLPAGKYLTFSGEAYEGRALGIFSSGLGESVGAVGTAGQHGVESRGGWAQAQVNWNKLWQTNLVYGLDLLNSHQLPVGNRDKNQTYMGNLIYKLAPNLSLAWEWKRFLTNYRNQKLLNELGDHIDMAVAFTF